MISLVSISEFFNMILPMFEFLLVFAALLFLIHLKLKTDQLASYFRNISSDIRKIADNITKDDKFR